MARNGRMSKRQRLAQMAKKRGLYNFGKKLYPIAKGVSAPVAFLDQISAKHREAMGTAYTQAPLLQKGKILANIVTGSFSGINLFPNEYQATQNINPAGMFNKWTTGGLTMLGYKVIGSKVNQMGFGSIVPATREIGGIGKSFIAGGTVGGLFDPPADNKPQNRGTAQYSIQQGTQMSSGDSTVSGL